MKNIRLVLQQEFNWPDDVAQIVQSFANAGFNCTPYQAHHMWEEYSDSMCAGWMGLPSSDDDIIRTCRPYFTVVEDF